MKSACGLAALTLSVFISGSTAVATAQIPATTRPVQLKPLSSAPITMHLTDESKAIYLAIGKLAGLNVIFDPDYQSRQVQIDITNLSLSDALRIVAETTGTFYKVAAPDTIFVAANTHAKHADLDDLTEQTFFLKNTSQQSDANEIYTALRNMLPPDARSFLVADKNAILVHSTPENIALAQKLLNELDQPKKTYRLTYTVTEMDSGKRVNIRHFAMIDASGQQATLKQGSKIPIVTGSYSTGGADAKAAAGVQTQVTYLDIGMNFDATVTTVGDSITIKSNVEQSSLADEKSGVGPEDPILRQTSLKGVFSVTPGKPVMLGSVDIVGSTRHLDIEVTVDPLP
jgi:type II secretory pathway component GspD/PulD (secretin)